MVAGSGAVSDGIWKWDNGSSAFPSVTLLWELLEVREKGEAPPSTSITSAFQGGGRGAGGEAPLTMGTRQKAESLATGAGEPEPRFPARRAGHPGGAPVGGRPCI